MAERKPTEKDTTETGTGKDPIPGGAHDPGGARDKGYSADPSTNPRPEKNDRCGVVSDPDAPSIPSKDR